MASKAAELLAGALEERADAHEAGSLGDELTHLERVRSEVSNMNDIPRPMYKLAMRFWKEWATTSANGWETDLAVEQDQWPAMARTIAQHVRTGRLPPDKQILNNFVRRPRSFGTRYIKWILKKSSSQGAQ